MDSRKQAQLLKPQKMLSRFIAVHDIILDKISRNRDRAFRKQFRPLPNGQKKMLADVDYDAENDFADLITSEFGAAVVVYGEESIDETIDLTGNVNIHMLVDMIDGTDLLERGFSNWCSAAVVFDPRGVTILASYVLMRQELETCMYYATREMSIAKKMLLMFDKNGNAKIRDDKLVTIPERSRTRTLENAGICMYGQKWSALQTLLSFSQKDAFMRWLENNKTEDRRRKTSADPELGFRFYDFAGNPMMARLGEGIVDVVFDKNGQAPHDVVPGAYIAKKAGGVMKDFDGKMLDDDSLAGYLLTPEATRIRYVLAANEQMADKLISLLQ